jgi:hypothetical protein
MLRTELAWSLLVVIAAAFVAFFVSLQAGVALLAFAVLAWWAWLNPELAFIFLLILALLLPMLKVTHTLGILTLSKDVLIVTLFIKTFLWPLVRRQLPYRRAILLAPLIVLGIYTAAATLRADSLLLGILRARDIGLYALLYLAVLYLPQHRAVARPRYWWLALAAVVVMALGIYQYFWAVDSTVLRFDPARSIWIPRLSSTFGHPTVFGHFLGLILTLTAATVVYAKSPRYRLVALLLALLTLPFIYLTYSRGVWIGVAGSLVAMGIAVGLQRLRQRGFKILHAGRLLAMGLIIVAVLSVALIRFTPVGVFVRSAFDPTYTSNAIRLEFAIRLLAPMSNLDALIGRGLGDVVAQTFREVELETFDIATGADREVQLTKDATLVDNQYLKTFVEMGLFGVLIYGLIYWLVLRQAWRLLKSTETQAKIVGLFGVGFVVAFVLEAFFVDIWDTFPTNAAFWIVAALISAEDTPNV